MLKRILALAAIVFVTACATSAPKTFSGEFQHPPAHSRVLVMTPDVQLSVLMLAGTQEPREEWSNSGRTNLAVAVAAYVNSKGHTASALDPATAMAGHVGQVIRLHDAVGQSILMINYLGVSVPTRQHNFEWTLGEGVRELGDTYHADYALFINGRGTYSSGARMAASVLTLSPTAAGQRVFASLVDLHTGNIVWFNVATAGPDQDMREAAGAVDLVNTLMDKAPL